MHSVQNMARVKPQENSSPKRRPMPSHRDNPFRKRRGEPAWASTPVLKQSAKRWRLVDKGISGHQSKAEMREIGNAAAQSSTIHRVPAGKRTSRQAED